MALVSLPTSSPETLDVAQEHNPEKTANKIKKRR